MGAAPFTPYFSLIIILYELLVKPVVVARLPTDVIFFFFLSFICSDPDFCGFVIVYCEEKCKIEYHMGCWKDYKETSTCDEVGRLSEKVSVGAKRPFL